MDVGVELEQVRAVLIVDGNYFFKGSLQDKVDIEKVIRILQRELYVVFILLFQPPRANLSASTSMHDMFWVDATPDPPKDIDRSWFEYLRDLKFEISLHKLVKVPVHCTEVGCKRNAKVCDV